MLPQAKTAFVEALNNKEKKHMKIAAIIVTSMYLLWAVPPRMADAMRNG